MHRARIDCNDKTITLSPSDTETIKFQGDRSQMFQNLVSTLKAERLLRQRCVAFLATINVRNNFSSLDIKDILVLNEFEDIFFKKVTWFTSSQGG